MTSWEHATLETSAVQLPTGGLDPASSSHDTAEWQANAAGPKDELLFEEYRPYTRSFGEHLNRLGQDGWELVQFGGSHHALYPTGYVHSSGTQTTVVESRFVLRRPA